MSGLDNNGLAFLLGEELIGFYAVADKCDVILTGIIQLKDSGLNFGDIQKIDH
jgi:hypothetical protein